MSCGFTRQRFVILNIGHRRSSSASLVEVMEVPAFEGVTVTTLEVSPPDLSLLKPHLPLLLSKELDPSPWEMVGVGGGRTGSSEDRGGTLICMSVEQDASRWIFTKLTKSLSSSTNLLTLTSTSFLFTCRLVSHARMPVTRTYSNSLENYTLTSLPTVPLLPQAFWKIISVEGRSKGGTTDRPF